MNVDKLTSFLAHCEHNHSVDKGEESVILSHTYIEAGMMLCTSLTLENVSGAAVGASENFHTQSFAF